MESTSTRARLSAAGELNVTGMVAAAAGIILQIASGSDLYPMIPPGPTDHPAGWSRPSRPGTLPMGRRVVLPRPMVLICAKPTASSAAQRAASACPAHSISN
jgi:hypothetical protein